MWILVTSPTPSVRPWRTFGRTRRSVHLLNKIASNFVRTDVSSSEPGKVENVFPYTFFPLRILFLAKQRQYPISQQQLTLGVDAVGPRNLQLERIACGAWNLGCTRLEPRWRQVRWSETHRALRRICQFLGNRCSSLWLTVDSHTLCKGRLKAEPREFCFGAAERCWLVPDPAACEG